MTAPGAVGRATDRLTASGASDWRDHVARLGPLPTPDLPSLVDLLDAAGLTGRGGGGFPAARKLAAVAAGRTRAVVVANGSEGEPASNKDQALLHAAPHLVLDGLEVVATALGTSERFLYAAPAALDGPVRRALAERGDSRRVTTVPAPDTFVAGQETAVVAAVHRRRAVPTTTPPAVWERGVDRRPTLVQNVETLAHIAMIVRRGPDWFRRAGTPTDPGTRLLTVSGAVHRPGIAEVPGGTSLSDVLTAAGGPLEPLQAVLVGGYHGGWVPWTPTNADLPLERRTLQRFEAAPGAGVVVALPARACGVEAAARIVAYLADQSTGQCGPCRFGLPAAAGLFDAVARRHAAPGAARELRRLTKLVDGRGACAHPDGTARHIRSALAAFAHEVDRHLDGVCSRDGGGGRR